MTTNTSEQNKTEFDKIEYLKIRHTDIEVSTIPVNSEASKQSKKEFNKTEYFKIQFIVIGLCILIGVAFGSFEGGLIFAAVSAIALNMITIATFKVKKKEVPDWLEQRGSNGHNFVTSQKSDLCFNRDTTSVSLSNIRNHTK